MSPNLSGRFPNCEPVASSRAMSATTARLIMDSASNWLCSLSALCSKRNRNGPSGVVSTSSAKPSRTFLGGCTGR